MEINKVELEEVAQADEQSQIFVQDLNDLALALVGGGIGSVIVA